MKIAPIVALLLALGRITHAQPPPLMHFGAGGLSCGEWVAVQKQQDPPTSDTLKKAMIVSWVQGHLVGAASIMTLAMTRSADVAANQKRFGTVSGLVYDLPDLDAITQWLVNYCEKNPLNIILVAAFSLHTELVDRNPSAANR